LHALQTNGSAVTVQEAFLQAAMHSCRVLVPCMAALLSCTAA
jgi:hypothetical protein